MTANINIIISSYFEILEVCVCVLCVKSESNTGRNAVIIISDVKTQHRNVDYLTDLVKV